MTGKSSPEKIIRKPILQTPTRHTPRRVATPKPVRIQSEVTSDMTAPDSDPTPTGTPVMVHGGARPKTPIIESTPLAPPNYAILPFTDTALNSKKNTFFYTIRKEWGEYG